MGGSFTCMTRYAFRRKIYKLLISVCLCLLVWAFSFQAKANASINLECEPYKSASSGLAREYSDGIVNLDPGAPIDALIAFIEFTDKRAVYSDRKKLNLVAKEISKFYSFVSENTVKFNWHLHQSAIQLGEKIMTYQVGSRGNSGTAQIIKEAQELMNREFRTQEFDYILFVSPSTTNESELPRSVAYLDRGIGIVNSTILASDFWRLGGDWRIAAHEIGHGFGLLDLYSDESAMFMNQSQASYFDQFKFMRNYDLMNWPHGTSPSFVMWNRLHVTPRLSNRVVCYEKEILNYRLTSINSLKPGFKAILVPLSVSKLLMIEVRDGLGVDSRIQKSDIGVITYSVDLKVSSGKGPLKIQCSQAINSKHRNCGLKIGQSRLIGGMQITFWKERFGYFFVKVQLQA